MLSKIIADKQKELKSLQEKKKNIGSKLKAYMEEKHIKSTQGVTLEEVTPKTRTKGKTRKEREEIAVAKLKQVGVPNPRSLLVEMEFK